MEYLTRSQGPATAAVGATTNVALQGKDTEWSDDQPPREWIRGYAAHQIFANLYYDFPNESPWTPYVGGGLGVVSTTLNYANQFIRKPDAEYLRIDFEPDWPDAAKRAAAGTLSSLDTTIHQKAFAVASGLPIGDGRGTVRDCFIMAAPCWEACTSVSSPVV